MKVLHVGFIILWMSLSSFSLTNNDAPLHSTPTIEVFISENESKELLITLKVEKIFLKQQGITNTKFKVEASKLKPYISNHFKVYTDNKLQKLQLKSISESKLRANIQYKIKTTTNFQSLKIFSDCMAGMEYHDRMPIRVKIRNTKKTYQINKKRTFIQINKL